MRPVLIAVTVLGLATIAAYGQASLPPDDRLQPGARVWLHAHNCYVEKGQYADRIDRALATGARHLAIEQDVAWAVDPATGRGRPVVSHEAKPDGSEPTLEAHFFDRVRPLMERALAENRRDTWPVLVLHLDFKTNEPVHHQAIWELLGRHQAWLTTAERTTGDRVMPFSYGPLLVLTENGEGQAAIFHERVPRLPSRRRQRCSSRDGQPTTGGGRTSRGPPSSEAGRRRLATGRRRTSSGCRRSCRGRTSAGSGCVSTR